MKETNVKRLHTAWFQLYDSWKKQNYRNSKKTNGCLERSGDGQREGWTEHRELFTVVKLLCMNIKRWVLSLFSYSVVPNSWRPNGLYPARLLCLWDFSGKNTRWVAFVFSRGSSHPGIEPTSLAWADGFFTTDPPGKPIRLDTSHHPFVYIHREYNTEKRS